MFHMILVIFAQFLLSSSLSVQRLGGDLPVFGQVHWPCWDISLRLHYFCPIKEEIPAFSLSILA